MLIDGGFGTSVSTNGNTIVDTYDPELSISGSSNTVVVNFIGATISSNSNSIVFNNTNLTGTINGTGNIIIDYGGDALSVSNDGNTTYLRSTGSSVLTNNSTVHFDSSNVTASVTSNGDNVNIWATGDTANVSGSSDITWIHATNAVINSSNSTTAIDTARLRTH